MLKAVGTCAFDSYEIYYCTRFVAAR